MKSRIKIDFTPKHCTQSKSMEKVTPKNWWLFQLVIINKILAQLSYHVIKIKTFLK